MPIYWAGMGKMMRNAQQNYQNISENHDVVESGE